MNLKEALDWISEAVEEQIERFEEDQPECASKLKQAWKVMLKEIKTN